MIVELDLVLYGNVMKIFMKIVTKAQFTHHIHASPKRT